MKRVLAAAVAIAMVTPSIAMARPSVEALSLGNAAAVQPMRASALTGKKLRTDGDNATLYYVLGALAAGLLIWCAADFCKGSKSP